MASMPAPTVRTTYSDSGTHRAIVAGCVTAGAFIFVVAVGLLVFHRRLWQSYCNRVSARPALTFAGAVGEDGKSAGVSAAAADEPDNTNLTVVDLNDTAACYAMCPLPRTPPPKQLQLRTAEGPRMDEDINALAMEVAVALLHTPPRAGSREQQQRLDARRNHVRHGPGSSDGSETSAPPNYSFQR